MSYAAANDPNKTVGAQGTHARTQRQARSYAKAKAIAPSNTVDLTAYAGGLVVLVGGDLKILPAQNADTDTLTFTAVTAGQVIPIQTRRVFATGTTATVASLDV